MAGYDALGTSPTTRLYAIATQVAQRFSEPVESLRTQEEYGVGSGLPGDTHGRLIDPEPFRGMGLSVNPKPRISPQTMPATIERPYVLNRKLTHFDKDNDQSPYLSSDDPRHKPRHV